MHEIHGHQREHSATLLPSHRAFELAPLERSEGGRECVCSSLFEITMNLSFKGRVPLFELTLLVVVVIIGWAEVRLYQISQEVEEEHDIARRRFEQLSTDLAR